ncbi:hypothetical protein NDU88_005616 [Pleurodeles waltl]|uniref:Uncharacterized protein n=1 Tax=Pleurodeles waltl TaxID=8319 RepID=A0AAV7MYY9_PLEWA|nr:hypothetical protein NDU88_005616 [Pleurodeles waltl]
MPSKARWKQCLEEKPLTTRHSMKNQDAMEPELQVLPMLVYRLIYQEHQRRRRRRWLLCGGSDGAGGGAASGGGKLQLVSCSLGRPPTGAAGAGSGPTVSGAGGGACSGDAGGAGPGAGASAASGGGRLQPFSCSLGRLPTGDAVADSSGSSGGAGGGVGGWAAGGAAGGAARSADGRAGSSAGGYQAFTCILCWLKCLAFDFLPLPHLGRCCCALGSVSWRFGGGFAGWVLLLAFAACWPLLHLGGWRNGLFLCRGWWYTGFPDGCPFEPLGVAGSTLDGDLVAEVLGWVLVTLARVEGRGGGVGKRSMFARKRFLDTLGREDGEGLGLEEEGVVVGGVFLLSLGEGAWAGCCCEVDGCWVGGCLRLCTLGGGVTDPLGEDTGYVCMVVGVVTANERCVVMGILVMEVVDEDVLHAGVSGNNTGREVDEEEEGDTMEAVDIGVSAWVWCLCECL